MKAVCMCVCACARIVRIHPWNFRKKKKLAGFTRELRGWWRREALRTAQFHQRGCSIHDENIRLFNGDGEDTGNRPRHSMQDVEAASTRMHTSSHNRGTLHCCIRPCDNGGKCCKRLPGASVYTLRSIPCVHAMESVAVMWVHPASARGGKSTCRQSSRACRVWPLGRNALQNGLRAWAA